MKRKCKQCGEVWDVDEDHFYRSTKSKSGFDLGACRKCRRKCRREYHQNKLRRIIKKPRVEQPLTPFDRACLVDQVRRGTEPTVSIFQEI